MTVPVLPAFGDPPPAEALRAAVAALASGGVVAIPTDTVYGLAVDPFQPGATRRVFEAKRRPQGVPLPVLVSGLGQVERLAVSIPPIAAQLMARYWPGALTIVVRRREDLSLELDLDLDSPRGAGAGGPGPTVGVRCPDHPLARALAEAAGPLATTSANRHGGPPAMTAGEVVEIFAGEIALVLDGGRCSGAPSTVVDCTGETPRTLRRGDISISEAADPV